MRLKIKGRRSAEAMADDNLIPQTEARQDRVRSFAFVIGVSVCILLSICFAVSSFAGLKQSFEIELDEKINPNNAPLGSLVRLPGIGVSRAGAIVAYREDFGEKGGKGLAFRNCEDLQKVKGIGPKTIENIKQWLKFE